MLQGPCTNGSDTSQVTQSKEPTRAPATKIPFMGASRNIPFKGCSDAIGGTLRGLIKARFKEVSWAASMAPGRRFGDVPNTVLEGTLKDPSRMLQGRLKGYSLQACIKEYSVGRTLQEIFR